MNIKHNIIYMSLLVLLANTSLPDPASQGTNLARPAAGFRDSATTLRMLSPGRQQGGLPGAAGGSGAMKLLRVGQQGPAPAGQGLRSTVGGGLASGTRGREQEEEASAAARDVRLLRVGRGIGAARQEVCECTTIMVLCV